MRVTSAIQGPWRGTTLGMIGFGWTPGPWDANARKRGKAIAGAGRKGGAGSESVCDSELPDLNADKNLRVSANIQRIYVRSTYVCDAYLLRALKVRLSFSHLGSAVQDLPTTIFLFG